MKIKIVLTIFFILSVLIIPASAWLSGCNYRVPIEINNTGDNLTEYQYNFTINTTLLISTGKLNINGSDLKITNSSDSLLSFWNYSQFNNDTTKIFVNATFLSNVSNTTHYIYYGGCSDTPLSSHSNTMDQVGYIPTTGLRDGNLIGWFKFDYNESGYNILDYSTTGRNATFNGAGTVDYSFNELERFDASEIPTSGAQGIAIDSNYIYGLTSYYPANGNWNSSVMRYYHNGTYKDMFNDLASSYHGGDMTFSDGNIFDDGHLYMALREYPVDASEHNMIVVYNVSDFSEVENWTSPIEDAYVLESIDQYNGYYWLLYGCGPGGCTCKVEQRNTSWGLINTHSLNAVAGYGYQSISWIGTQIYVNIHEGTARDELDIYDWNGAAFVFNKSIMPPSYAHQGIGYYNNNLYFISRSNAAPPTTAYIVDPSPFSTGFTSNYGKYKGSFNYDGTDDYIDFNNTNVKNEINLSKGLAFADTDTFAVELWYKGTDLTSNGDHGTGLISWDSANLYAGFILRSGYVEYLHYDGVWTHNIKSTTLVSDGDWHHIVYNNYANETGDLFIDNVREITKQSSSISQATRYFQVKQGMRTAYDDYTHGLCDELMFYNKTLSLAKINAHNEERKYTTTIPISSLGSEENLTQQSVLTIPANSWVMFNNWTSSTTFSQIATNESNDVVYSYYNVTSGEWESYYVGYSWNANNIVGADNSIMGFFDTQTTITATVVTPSSTALSVGWNMLFVEGTDNETVASIKSDIGANCTDVWWFNSTSGAYSNTTTDIVQYNLGFLAYINTAFTWTRSDL